MPNLDRILPFVTPLVRHLVRSPMRDARRRQFEAMPLAPGRVVFLGDSLTEQGGWDGWFPDLPTLNRGINGHTISDVLARLDSALYAPKVVSLMIGTNDLRAATNSDEVADVANRMRLLVQRIRGAAPDAKLIVNSVTPRAALFRDRILDLNQRNRVIAAENGAVFLDLWPAFAGPGGEILQALAVDGLHLSGEGYRVWVEHLRPHLAEFSVRQAEVMETPRASVV